MNRCWVGILYRYGRTEDTHAVRTNGSPSRVLSHRCGCAGARSARWKACRSRTLCHPWVPAQDTRSAPKDGKHRSWGTAMSRESDDNDHRIYRGTQPVEGRVSRCPESLTALYTGEPMVVA